MKSSLGFDTRWIAPAIALLWLATLVTLGSTLGSSAFFLALAGGALLLAISLFWRSTQSLTEDSPLSLEEALGMGAPTTEEERKESVLRILKDLEYERAVGKLEDTDYRELAERYRAEARALLSNVEQGLGPARRRAEALLEARLGEQNVGKDPSNADPDLSKPDESKKAEPKEATKAAQNSDPAPVEAKDTATATSDPPTNADGGSAKAAVTAEVGAEET
jgi:hypothetical protein